MDPEPAGRRGRERAEDRERDHRQRRQQPDRGRRHPERVAHLLEHRADADRCRPEVEREEDDPDHHEDGGTPGCGAHSPMLSARLSVVSGRMGRMRQVSDGERRHRLARRHALAPGHRAADPVAATRAMTVLHATEAPTRLPVPVGPRRRAERRRRRPGALRGPQPGQAAGDAAHPVRLPARPAARRLGECLGAGGRCPSRPAGQGRRGRRTGHRRRRLGRRRRGRHPRPPRRRRRAVGAAAPRGGARARRPDRDVAGQVLRRQRPDRASGPHPARGRGQDRARAQRRSLAHRPAAVDR